MTERCRPPLRASPARMAPSPAFPWRCECGYHFRTRAQRLAHQIAYIKD